MCVVGIATFLGYLENDRDKLRAKCGWRWCRRRPRVPHLGPVDQAARSPEAVVAFACWYPCGVETAVAFAGTGRASNETGIAFAGENWVFLARFSLALVLPVSMGVVQGRALVMVVSRWPVSVAVEVSLVASSPPQCVLCAKKFALRGLVVGVSAKSSPCVLIMAQNRRFMACWANFFAGQVEKACCWANFVAPASLPRPPSLAVGPPLPAGPMARPCGASGTLHIGHGGGVCTTRSLLAACRRRVGPPCSAIPPFGGREFAA